MRVLFLGTPDFAVKPFIALLSVEGVEVIGAVCNVDKPVGRKMIITPPPVKTEALKRGIPVFQYNKIRAEGVEDLKRLAPDLMITCAFGQILSQEILDIPKLGVLNIHASLLPKYRGASPIHYAILNGEKITGITIMKTVLGIDAGDVLLQKKIEIEPSETCGELFARLSVLGAQAIVEALTEIKNGTAKFVPQNNALATFTKMIKKEDALIDFNDSAEKIVNKIRAFNPSPVAYTFLFGEPFKIYNAAICEGNGKAGEIILAEKQLIIACKEGAIKLLTVQKAGSKPMSAEDFLRGNKLTCGELLGK